jgi:hypothetical protein
MQSQIKYSWNISAKLFESCVLAQTEDLQKKKKKTKNKEKLLLFCYSIFCISEGCREPKKDAC